MSWEAADSFIDSFLRMQQFKEDKKDRKAQRARDEALWSRQAREWQQQDEIDSAMRQGAESVGNKGGLRVTPEFMKQAMPNIDDGAARELAERVGGLRDPRQAAEVVKQYQQHYAMRGIPTGGEQAQTSPVDMPGQQAAQERQPAMGAQPQIDPQSFRAYKGDDGQIYMAAGPEYKPKQSEIMMEQARKLMSGAGGARGAQVGMELQKQAADLMKVEHEQEFMTVMNLPTFQERVNGLVGMLNGSATTPGTAELRQGPNGEVQLVHTVPGKEEPHVTTISGGSKEEILNNLAMRVRERTNPDIYFKRMEMEAAQKKQMFDQGMKVMELGIQEDQLDLDREYKMGNLDLDREYKHGALAIDRAQLAQQQAQFNKEFGLRAANAADERQQRAFARAADKARLDRERWKPYGMDAAGNHVFYDENSDKFRVVKNPNGVTPFSKVSGEKADTEGEKQYRRWLTEYGGMDETPAKQEMAARRLGVDPAKFGLGMVDPAAVAASAKQLGLGKKKAPPPAKLAPGLKEKLKRETGQSGARRGPVQ